MDCKTVREKLGEYRDGTAGTRERQLMEEHLSACKECSSALEELDKTISLLGTLENVEPPPWLSQKVMTKVREEKQRTSVLRRLFSPLRVKVPIQAAATVLIAIATIYVFRTIQHEVIYEKPAPGLQEKTVIKDKGKDAAHMTGRVQTPAMRDIAKETPPPREMTPTETLHQEIQSRRRNAPGPPESTGKAMSLKEEKAGVSVNEPENRQSQNAMRDALGAVKSPGTETGGLEATVARQRDEDMREPSPVPSRFQRPEKVLWKETITKEDIAKVMKLALLRETENELVFEVEYYLSEAFPGGATVRIYPDISDRTGGVAPALPGKHIVNVSISRLPSALPGTSKNLSIEIVRQEDAASRRPLYRKTVSFVKRWGTD